MTLRYRRMSVHSFAAAAFLLLAATQAPGQARSPAPGLSTPEGAEDWIVLFDGKSTTGWRGFRSASVPECWVVEDGILQRRMRPGERTGQCGDIITQDQFSDFHLEFEWRITARGNSGLKYFLIEDRPWSWEEDYARQRQRDLKRQNPADEREIALVSPESYRHSPIGFEFQLIDDDRNSDARRGENRVSGALYDLIAPSRRAARPAGEWNTAAVMARGNHIEHWLNGVRVLDLDRTGEAFKAALKQSKFANLEGFADLRKGHIGLQNHESGVWFRNIRIRRLPD